MRFFSTASSFTIILGVLGGCQLIYTTREASGGATDDDADGAAPDGGDATTTPRDGGTDAWPDETNTGPGSTALAPTGSLTLSNAGEIVESIDVSGDVSIKASDITLRRCRVRSDAQVLVRIDEGLKGVRIEDCEIAGTGTVEAEGVHGPAAVSRCNIHHVQSAVVFAGEDLRVEDSYLWGLEASSSAGFHGIKMDGNVKRVRVLHNVIQNPKDSTSAVMINNYAGPVSDIIVDRNRLAGGSYPLYSDARSSSAPITGVVITNNRIRKGEYGYALIMDNTVVQSGNVDDATGAAINF